MNREEILAKSQKENHGKDIADLAVSRDSMQIGWLVILCVLAAVTVVDALVFGRMNSEVFFAVMTGCSAVFFFKFLGLRKKHELILSLFYALAAVAFLIAWIFQLTRG